MIVRSHLKPLFKYQSHIILVLLYPSQLCLRKSSQPLYDLLKWFQLHAASCQVFLSIGCIAYISRLPGRLEIISFKVPRTFSGTQGLNLKHESNCPKYLWHLEYKSSIILKINSKNYFQDSVILPNSISLFIVKRQVRVATLLVYEGSWDDKFS